MALLRDLVGDIKDSLYAKTKEGRAYTKDGSLDWEVYAIDRNWDKVKRKVFKTSKQDPPDKAEREAYVYANTLNKESEKSEHGLYRAVTVKRLVGDSVEDAGENGYVAFYKGKRIEVYAATKYEAQKKAAEIFKAKNSYDVNVMLAEKEGKQVTHLPLDSQSKEMASFDRSNDSPERGQPEDWIKKLKKQLQEARAKGDLDRVEEIEEEIETERRNVFRNYPKDSQDKSLNAIQIPVIERELDNVRYSDSQSKDEQYSGFDIKKEANGQFSVYWRGHQVEGGFKTLSRAKDWIEENLGTLRDHGYGQDSKIKDEEPLYKKGDYSVYHSGTEYLIYHSKEARPLAARASLSEAKKFIEGDKGSVKYKDSQSNDAECSKCGQQLRDNEKTYGNGLCKKCDTTKTSTIFAKGKLHQKSYNDSGDGDEKKYFVSYLTRGDGGNVFRQTIESNLSKEKAEQIARQWKIINGKNTEVKEMTSFDAQDYYDALKESFNN